MPLTKVFGTTSASWATATSWKPVSLRSATYAWTASGSGTNEYYVRTVGGADPGIGGQPGNIYINGANATEATAGSLALGQWDYADNDTLGYSTVYVRLSDGTDPDSKAVDYVQLYQVPVAGQHVRFAVDSATPSAGLDQSSVALGDFIVEEGCQATFGSTALGYLHIDPDRFEFSGNGAARINLNAAAIPVQVYRTAGVQTGERGLYLRGSALTVVNIMGGSVGLASLPGETSTATTVRVMGGSREPANVWLGNGLTLTNLHQFSGESRVRCNVTTTILYDGKMWLEENAALTTITQHAGECVYQSSGNITTHNLYGGTLDEQKSGATRTISTLNKYRGSWQILRNKEAVTHTTETPQDSYTEAGTF
jgi:hypothetical protein